MNIKIKKLGALFQADFSLGELTIICGRNNTGKTYATYAIYGFLDYWRSAFEIDIPKESVNKLLENGTVTIDLTAYKAKYDTYLARASKEYSSILSKVFAGNEKRFKESEFALSLDSIADMPSHEIDIKLAYSEKRAIQFLKTENSDKLRVSMLIKEGNSEVPDHNLTEQVIGDVIKRIVFEFSIPQPFIASAERTGSTIFQKELDFTRNRIVDLLGDKTAKLNPFHLLGKFKADYPIPVRKNVDFTRELPNITNHESYISREHPEILNSFTEIIGGEFKVSKESEIQFIPSANKRIRLPLVESSSAVRSLLDVGFYLRHVAREGDLLMVDEPELNLHPENQRRVARLFAQLINAGIKVFISTHSDYIIKELNTLIMLGRDMSHMKKIVEREKYHRNELLSSDKVKVYIAEDALVAIDGKSKKQRKLTLTRAKIDADSGIEVRSFDSTIDEMNRIQEEILWGDD